MKSLIDAILELPGCHRTITLALRELEEVDYTLKNIHAKIRFLPGTYDKKVTLTTCTEGIQAILEILATEQTGIRKCINTLQLYAIA